MTNFVTEKDEESIDATTIATITHIHTHRGILEPKWHMKKLFGFMLESEKKWRTRCGVGVRVAEFKQWIADLNQNESVHCRYLANEPEFEKQSVLLESCRNQLAKATIGSACSF